MKKIALVGMPNCGKSSLFNLLTGKHAHIGNRAGVTVCEERAVMHLQANGSKPQKGAEIESVTVVDLPGIRSMKASSADERETLRVLSTEDFNLILFVCDATDPARHHAFLCDLCGFLCASGRCRERPQLAVAFNFCDELARFPDSAALGKALELPAAAISARCGQGIAELKDLLAQLLLSPEMQTCAACRITQRCALTLRRVKAVLGEVLGRAEEVSARIDRLFFAPVVGYVLFFFVMAGILWSVFGPIGAWLTALFRGLTVTPLSLFLARVTQNAPVWLSALLCNGVLGGVGAVLDFLPRLLLLFAAQSLLEQTGILARFNRLFDGLTQRFGLTGEAMTALLLGYGCSVPAILCTRAVKNAGAAQRCACAIPVVACSARMPLCLCISQAFFGVGGWWITGAIWLLTGLCFFLFCAMWELFFPQRSRSGGHGDPLPRWRTPKLSETLLTVREQLAHFLGRAGGVILFCSVAVWALSSVDLRLRFMGDDAGAEGSIMAAFGRLVSPFLSPLGLGDWRLSVALLTGVGAKEAALSTLGVLVGDGVTPLAVSLASSGILTPASALSFLVFYCLYFPCAATVATLRAERRPLRPLVFLLVLAYLLAFAVYRLAVAVML